MKRHISNILIICNLQVALVGGHVLTSNAEASINSFSTNGQTVYHLQTGTLKKGERAIVTASIDGAVKCFTPQGKLIWQAGTNDGFPFDLCVADIDKDGLDEVLVASGNGSLYAFDNDGKQLWVFSKAPPLYQVTVAHRQDGSAIIVAGGVEQILYSLSPQREVIKTLATENCIRHVRAGNILGDGNEYVAVATTSSGLTGNLSLLLVDPKDLSVKWEKKNLGKFVNDSGKRFFSMLTKDINKDGKDEILLTGGWGENGLILTYDYLGNLVFSESDKKVPNIAYRMNLLKNVKLPKDEFILGHFGNVLIIYELNGKCREVIKGPYSFADSYFDTELQTLFMGSAVSGGDEVYVYHLDQPGWQKQFETTKATGKLEAIERNIKLLTDQIREFIPPAYQPRPSNGAVIAPKPKNREYSHLTFIESITLSQKIVDRGELWCKEVDNRRKYDLTADELVKKVETYEAAGQDFIIWAGHGTAVHFPLSTFERVIKASPKHLIGFVFAEMEGVTDHMQEVVSRIILPVAELCKESGKKIVFRNKNIFWNGTCYVPFWRNVLLNERYRSVFVPGLEETNCRSQELSLSGRIGLCQSGYFDHWLGRVTTDNANFDRMFEWGGQQVITHHLRNLISSASNGADIFFNTLQSANLGVSGSENKVALYDQLVPFYDMLEKGIIHIPQNEELLSLSELALGMKSPPSDLYIKHGTNGHKYWYPTADQTEMVFDHLDAYWGGSSLNPNDYSYYAFNVRKRMCNFLPETPFGMTTIVPSGKNPNDHFKNIVETDGQNFFDAAGKKYTAAEFKPQMVVALTEAAAKLPVVVRGVVHWSVVRLDAKHVRITLIDPGYLDPAERRAAIQLQHLKGVNCTDILSRESLPVKGGKIAVTIPAGVFRILDIEHQ